MSSRVLKHNAASSPLSDLRALLVADPSIEQDDRSPLRIGLRLTVPDRYSLCTDPAPSPLDGVSAQLDGRGCANWQDGPFVAISGSYNAEEAGMTPYAVARVYCSGPHERFYRQRVWIAGYPFYRCVGGPTAKDTVFTTLVASHDPLVTDWRIVEVWLHCPDGPCDKKAVAQVLKGLTIRRGSWDGD